MPSTPACSVHSPVRTASHIPRLLLPGTAQRHAACCTSISSGSGSDNSSQAAAAVLGGLAPEPSPAKPRPTASRVGAGLLQQPTGATITQCGMPLSEQTCASQGSACSDSDSDAGSEAISSWGVRATAEIAWCSGDHVEGPGMPVLTGDLDEDVRTLEAMDSATSSAAVTRRWELPPIPARCQM